MPNEMIERVAKATYEKFMEGMIGCTELSWNDLPEDHKDRMRDSAKAGIEAMREPTEKMLDIGNDFSPHRKKVWQAMIDAALKE